MTVTTTEKIKIKKKLDENIQYLTEKLAIEKNFDIIHRPLHYAGRDFAFVVIGTPRSGMSEPSILPTSPIPII